jgi:hypothetical protein
MNDREQHLKQVEQLIKTFADPCEGTIYHYTTGEGFLGIVESGELWLTNTEFVNDISECNALQQEMDLFGIDELTFNRYVDKWWKYYSRRNNERNNYYIASFSKEPDSLEQWRAYGDVCIGFRAERLKKSGFSLHECVYSKEEIKSWLLKRAKAKEWMLDEPDRTISYVRDGVATTRYEEGRDRAAFSLIFEASIKLKHSCYRNEKEVRLLAVSNHNWRYPNSPFMYEKDPPIYFRRHPGFRVAVPYVKFFLPTLPEGGEYDFSENQRGKTELQVKQEKREKEKKHKRELLPIQEIWIGPTPHKEETKVSCEILLHEKGYKDVQINVSEIPYRGF